MRHVLARVSSVPCDDCMLPIRCWNRRISLAGKRSAHLHCWNGRLLAQSYVRFMADEIGSPQLISGPSPDGGFSADIARLADEDVPGVDLAAPQDEPSQPVEAPEQKSAEAAVETRISKKYINGNLGLRELRLEVRHFLDRLGAHRPHRPSSPPRLCMLCGGVEFSERSVLCSKCGTSLRPWS
jgi:hypothetical protein